MNRFFDQLNKIIIVSEEIREFNSQMNDILNIEMHEVGSKAYES